MKGKHIPPCRRCHRNTPPLGELVCRACLSEEEQAETEQGYENDFLASIDEVADPATRQCLRALFGLLEGGIR